MDKIPEQTGYLVLNEDGAVLESGGELDNDERIARVVTELVSLASSVDPLAFTSTDQFKKISITYDDHCFIICLSNRKIYIVKKNIMKVATGDANTVNV